MENICTISLNSIESYLDTLPEQERSTSTVQKYRRDLHAFLRFLASDGWQDEEIPVTRQNILAYKYHLQEHYAPASVNSMLTVVNSLLKFLGMNHLCVKLLKRQRKIYLAEEQELTRGEFGKLVQAAVSENKPRLLLLMETMASTGIRVSELQFVTAEGVDAGRIEISCKGKERTVFLPKVLEKKLKKYMKSRDITSGPIFCTRTGKPLDRSNIWKEMKRLCEKAGVAAKKVFPHNLRHLFARVFYASEKDMVALADILGHSSTETTRIYTMTSARQHARKLDRLKLVC